METMLYGREHVRRYVETDGDEGYVWRRGTTILILTTKGRVSGKERDTPLIFREHDGRYLVVASNGGNRDHPSWFKNLRANPDVTVQVKGDRFAARARAADADERARLWPVMTEVWPDYDAYQKKTDREIPVVILERTA
ncbi:MAG TPA: nitroreductase family deazaflavin-dependent oxidoreductase [Jiangellaceae bacterium]|nr:nitroreductase family deazaflavin-dependent oxidoreductase [Jiangellaceae bacterium]